MTLLCRGKLNGSVKASPIEFSPCNHAVHPAPQKFIAKSPTSKARLESGQAFGRRSRAQKGAKLMGLYSADLSAGSLMIPEGRRIAELLLRRPGDAEWDHAIKVENILQKATPSTAVRQARLIRLRLEKLSDSAWALVVNGDQEAAAQTLFAAAVLHSALLHDFVRSVVASHHRRLETQLSPRAWDSFLADCAARDPAVETWTASTRAKLLQVIIDERGAVALMQLLDHTPTLQQLDLCR